MLKNPRINRLLFLIALITLNGYAVSGQSNFDSTLSTIYTIKATLLGKTSGEIKAADLKSATEIGLIGNDSDKYKILSFTMILYCRGMDPPEWHCEGKYICMSGYYRSDFSFNGCKMLFENIVVSDKLNHKYYLKQMLFNITK